MKATEARKTIMALIFTVFMTVICAIPCFAEFTMTGHYDPDGTTSTYYAYDSSECNRTVNVSMYDTNGTLIKKVSLKTKHGEDNSMHIGIGGYDIIRFSSDQGIWETCKLVWTSGTGSCTEADIFIDYYFRTALSAKTLNVKIIMRKWDPIKVEARHYIQNSPGASQRSNYTLYTTTDQQSVDYYNSFSTSATAITGYTLKSDYQSNVSGLFCYNLVGQYLNTPSSPRCHHYELHLTDWTDDMESWSSYDESDDGKTEWCNNRIFWVEYFYDLNKYTVSYDAKGGGGAPVSQTKYYNTDIAISDVIPTRSGYTFKGWGTDANSSYVNYSPGATYTANTSRTLYAIWEPNEPQSFTVSYNSNGGTGSPATQTKIRDVVLTLSSTQPTRRNYNFLGWSTSSTASTPSYYSGGTYSENANITLYAVWEYDPETFTVKYDANGGGSAPSSQTKTYGVALRLTRETPIRNGYKFLGWSVSSFLNIVEYEAGGLYRNNASATLYAVWERSTSDFSLSGMTLSESELNTNQTLTVTVKAYNRDRTTDYTNIPVQLYYDGVLIKTHHLNLDSLSYATMTFRINVGAMAGEKSVEIRINWDNRYEESNYYNNTVYKTVTVTDNSCDVAVEPVFNDVEYCEGTEVISSFYVKNNGTIDIIPSHHNNAAFTVYIYNGSAREVNLTQTWADVVVPTDGTNLVYFKWRVPNGTSGKTIYIECAINANGTLEETSYENNTATLETVISSLPVSQTPDTRFENKAPNSYHNHTVPSVSTDSATWTMWEYENGAFVLKKYGIRISDVAPVITPSIECNTAVYEDGTWTMKSGYGITINYSPEISSVSGYLHPDNNAYTAVQSVAAKFPEYSYFDADGNYRTLEYIEESYQFTKNSDANDNSRVHFIPIYVSNGDYVVSVTATQLWTPVGMIKATRNANTIIIDGTVYDDWYQG